MTENKHTPGPWAIHNHFPDVIVLAAHVDRPVDFSIYEEENERRYARTIARMDDHKSDEGKANARLIAAAPELLAALRRVDSYACHVCGKGYGDHSADCDVGMALRKATGTAS